MKRLFLYGSLLPGRADHGWVAAFPSQPATIRGRLYRSPRGRTALVFDGASRSVVDGRVAEVDDEVIGVLDIVFGVREGPLRRGSHPVNVLMRAEEAEVYTLDPFRRKGYLPLG